MSIVITQNATLNILVVETGKEDRVLPSGIQLEKATNSVKFSTHDNDLIVEYSAIDVTSVTDKDGTTTPIAGDNDLFFTTLKDTFFFRVGGSGGGSQTLDDVLGEGDTSDKNLVISAPGKVIATVESPGGTVSISQSIQLKAFAGVLENVNVETGKNRLGIKMPLTTSGTSGVAEVPEVGVETPITSQPIDTDLFTGALVTLPEFTGTAEFATSVIKYKFQDAGKPVKVRTVTDQGIDLFGTSADPYLYFTTVVGLNTIILDSPIATHIGSVYTTTIETEDGSDLNIFGDNSGLAKSNVIYDTLTGGFDAYIEVIAQSNELVDFNMEHLVDTASYVRMTAAERATLAGLASIEGVIRVVGFWNADANTPDLSTLTPDQGEAYQVSVEGSTNINGETNWKAKDLVVWSDTLAGNWFKIDNTDDVISVNGKTGVVVLDTSDIAPSTDRNYVTDAESLVIGNTSGENTGDQTLTDVINDAAITTSQTWSSDKINSELGGVYGELYRNSRGTQQVKNVDEIITMNSNGLSSGTTVDYLTDSITVLEGGDYKVTVSGSISTRRDKESFGKIGVNGSPVATLFMVMPETDNYFAAMSGSRIITLAANDVVTFMGYVDDGMDRNFYLSEGSSFRVEKV